MFDKIVLYLQSVILKYGGFGIFFATIVEEVIAPIPSPFIPLLAGFSYLPANKVFLEIMWQALFIIALPIAIGITIGSLVVYFLGYWGGKPIIEKCKKWIGLSWKDIEKMEKRLEKSWNDEIVFFILRCLPIIPGVAISSFSGLVRYPLKNFMLITFFGALVRAFMLGIVGWKVGELYITYADAISKMEKYTSIIVALSAILIFGYFYFFRRLKKKS